MVGPVDKNFLSLLEVIPDAMILTDREGRILYVNANAEKMFRYKGTELIGQMIELLVPDRYSGKHVHNRTSYMANPQLGFMANGLELSALRKDGTEFPVDILLNPLITSKGLLVCAIIHDITDHKDAGVLKDQSTLEFSNRLRHSTMMYENLVKTLSDIDVGVAIVEGTKNVFINEPLTRTLGYTTDELLALPWKSIIAPEDVAMVEEKNEDHLRHPHATRHGIVRVLHKNGERILIEYSSKVISTGFPPRLIFTLRDVTERHRADEALRLSTERYQSLFENSPISLWEEDFSEAKKYLDELKWTGVKDVRQYFSDHPKAVEYCASLVRVVEVNETTVRLYGATAKEQFYGSLKPILPESTNLTFMEELVAIAEGKTSFAGEDINRTFQGIPLNILIRWNVTPEDVGRYARVLVSIIDITGRKKIESQLHLLGHAVESTSEMISITDLDNRYIFVNKAFLDCYGYSLEEVIGKSPLMLRSPKNPEYLPQQIFDKTRTGGWMGEILNIRKDGSELPIYLGTSQVKDDHGILIGLIGVARDITDLRQAEEALVQAKIEMENLFARDREAAASDPAWEVHRSSSLQLKRDLARGIKDVVANVRASIQRTLSFASLASHELRTPLAVLRNELEGVLDFNASPTMLRQTIMSTYDEILQLDRTVEQMLALARMQAGTYKVEFRPLDIRELLRGIYDDAVVLTRQKNLSVVFSKSPKLVIRADVRQLRYVFFNLLDNAIKFTPTGGRIRFGYEKIGNDVIVEFSNTGRAIPRERLESIFEPFHGGKPQKSTSQGTGLGLALSKMIITAHHGTITVVSKATKGTTFRIQLPVDPDNLLSGQPA